MKVVVTGGRDYTNQGLVFAALDKLHRVTAIALLLHGACGWDADDPTTMSIHRLKGADGLADRWARERGVRVERVPAPWSSIGPAAGHRRNGWLLDAEPDVVMAFLGGPGTRDCVWQAKERGICVLDYRPTWWTG